MMRINLDDTITAVATPVGDSGIGIVRISGSKALDIADKIFISKDGRKPSDFKTYTTHYGFIAAGDARCEIIDEVILTVMRAPKSYTCQDIVEINCHGGIIPLRRTLELVLESGARLSKPGEFTQRAFLNGRIDLPRAEAVLDIIRAKTDSALKVGIGQLKGALSKKLNQLRDKLLDLCTILEANIDFPDQNLAAADIQNIAADIERINQELILLLENAKTGRVLREGIKVVICGRPNAGKSSLLNALLKFERSIVTPIAGTTRDTIEDILDIRGIPVRIVDTAGIIEPNDLIEKKAVSRSRHCIQEADLVLLVFDGSRALSPEDNALMRKIKSKPTLALINKIDLRQKIQRRQISHCFERIVEISAKKQKNLASLEEAIAQFVFDGKIKSDESIWISNLRHIQELKKAKSSVMRAKKSMQMNLSFEFISQDLKAAISSLDDILGKSFSGNLLDRIFNQFCIGK